tara:strand:+ start:44 stop:502 length:459 start_codon:yes stop_codon:yes gene_type:complete
MITKKSFVSARYIDEAKENIEILLKDGDITRPHIIEAKDNAPEFEELLKIISLDEIHELTYKSIKDGRKAFEDMVMKIAEAEGLVEATRKTDEVQLIIDIITTEIVDKEKLFKLKLSLFEMEKVKNSKARANKTALRKAETFVETMVAYSKF